MLVFCRFGIGRETFVPFDFTDYRQQINSVMMEIIFQRYFPVIFNIFIIRKLRFQLFLFFIYIAHTCSSLTFFLSMRGLYDFMRPKNICKKAAETDGSIPDENFAFAASDMQLHFAWYHSPVSSSLLIRLSCLIYLLSYLSPIR